jgi:hypothetical protein
LNQTAQRTGASRFAHKQIQRHRRLAPVADLYVNPITDTMKKCSYCGKDNADDALNCRECGTEFKPFSEPSPREAPKKNGPLSGMSSRQLANVLIKILGLWTCLQGIPSFVSGFLQGLMSHFSELARATSFPLYSWTYALGSTVYFAVGIFLIVRSRYVADKLFRSEDE